MNRAFSNTWRVELVLPAALIEPSTVWAVWWAQASHSIDRYLCKSLHTLDER